MKFLIKKLNKRESFENKIRLTCSYNYAKCEFLQGKIISIKKTNISIIEPHKVIIRIMNYSLLVIYYDEDNMFLLNRSMPIDIKQLEKILKHIKSEA